MGLIYEDMKILAKHVAARLEERAFCVVFENDLERCWPRTEMARSERERKIQAFAESHGWTAAILEGAFGIRAVFRNEAHRILVTSLSHLRLAEFLARRSSPNPVTPEVICQIPLAGGG